MTVYGVVLLSAAGVALAWLWIVFLYGLLRSTQDARAEMRAQRLSGANGAGSLSQDGG